MTMSFTSWEFWLLFACAFMASTWLNGTDSKLSEARAVRLRSALLLAFSAGFYLLAAAPCAVILASSVLLNHGLGKLIHKLRGPARAWTTALGVAFNVLGLAAFKYAFFIDDTFDLGLLTSGTFRLDAWMLPLGISFFTFQAISFLVDVHRRTLAKPPDLLAFATYLTFFPQLVAGPIVRATSFLPQLASPTWNTAPAALKPFGILLAQGMMKKVLLGDVVGTWLVDPAFENPGSTPAAWILVALYGYSLQVYADFSGYTDMAQGMAGLLGIHLPEISTSPTVRRLPADFWRRWHEPLPMVARLRLHPPGRQPEVLEDYVGVLVGDGGLDRDGLGVVWRVARALGRHAFGDRMGTHVHHSPQPHGHRRECPVGHAARRFVARSSRELRDVGRHQRRGLGGVDCALAFHPHPLATCTGMAVDISCGGHQPNMVPCREPGVLESRRRDDAARGRLGDGLGHVGQLDHTCHVHNGPHGGLHHVGGVGTRGVRIPPSPYAPFSQGILGGFRSKVALVGVLVFVDGLRRPRSLGTTRRHPPLHILAVLRPSSVRWVGGRLHLLVRATRFRLRGTRSQGGRQERCPDEPAKSRCESKFHSCKLEVWVRKVKPSGAAFKQWAVYF